MQPATQINNHNQSNQMGNTTNNNINSNKTIEDVYEEEKDAREYGASTDETITRIGILDEIEDKEIARWGASSGGVYGGRAGGGAPALMDTINTSTPIEDRIRILSGEMIRRGLETEESFKRLRSYEKKRNEYRCLMEELARYYDRQTVLGLPIEQPVLKTGIYMHHVILL